MDKREKDTAAQVAQDTETVQPEAKETAAQPSAVPETPKAKETAAVKPGTAVVPASAADETAEGNDRNRDLSYFINKVDNKDTQVYIRTRVVEQMEYYSKQSRACKKQYYQFTAVSIFLGALIPIASIFSDSTAFMKVVIASLGSAVTAINAYLALYNSKDFWITYRNTRETLLRTLYYYFNKTNMFGKDRTGKEMDQETRDKLLIQYCEKEMASENGSWRSTVEE